MAEKEVKSDDGKLDKILAHLDSVSERLDKADEERKADRSRLDAVCTKMDADDKSRKDAAEKEEDEKKKADAARKDTEDKEKEEKAKADAAKADAAKKDAEEKEKEEKAKADARADSSGAKKLQEQIDALSRRLPADLPPDIRQRMVGFQSKAERVFQAMGDSNGAPPPAYGESEMDFRIRLLSPFKKYSKAYKDADLAKIGDPAVFGMIEDSIYADAVAEATHPSTVSPGVLIPQRTKDAADRTITRYVGDPNACWDLFNPPVRHVRRLLTSGAGRVH